MTALVRDRGVPTASWFDRVFLLATGYVAYRGGAAFLVIATGKVVPATAAGAGTIYLGTFMDAKVSAVGADKPVNILLGSEIHLTYFTAAAGITSTDVGKLCYFDDDQTVTTAAGARTLAGRILHVKQTATQPYDLYSVGVDTSVARCAASRPLVGAPLLFVSNAATPADVVHGAVHDVPTTAAASTITLPAAALDGTIAYFSADGVSNGHTVQYRDATGPTIITPAFTALKRHLVTAAKVNGKWRAAYSESP